MPRSSILGHFLVVLLTATALRHPLSAIGPAGASKPTPAAAAARRTVAVTVDDLPFVAHGLPLEAVTLLSRDLVAALAARKVKAVAFVNDDRLFVPGEVDARIALLTGWLDAGMELGNHTFGHPGLTKTPLPAMQDAVIKGEAVTRGLLERRGQKLRWFRHPYAQTGTTREIRDAFEAFLASRGYTVAPLSIEHEDWVFASADAKLAADHDEPGRARLLAAYLEDFDARCAFYEGRSRALFGREIPQILLSHANALNARAMPFLLERLEKRGYAFVTLEEALSDPAWKSPDGYFGPWGPSWLHRFAAARGEDVKALSRAEPEAPKWVTDLDAARTSAASASAAPR
ncbi:MAG: polysaccharide deacetylase family protein [Deltaproteobacteria bacterium]|nr:polysaccharide deacetylase family protein [Deltaproteobacteria bacterium]